MSIYYRTVIRPVGYGSLPHGVKWEWVETPSTGIITHRPDLPRSSYYYGVFTTDRPLTRSEMNHFDIAVVPHVPQQKTRIGDTLDVADLFGDDDIVALGFDD